MHIPKDVCHDICLLQYSIQHSGDGDILYVDDDVHTDSLEHRNQAYYAFDRFS